MFTTIAMTENRTPIPFRILLVGMLLALSSVSWAGHWTVIELDGQANYVLNVGDAATPLEFGTSVPERAFVTVTSGNRLVLQSGDEQEVVPLGPGILLRRAPADGISPQTLDLARQKANAPIVSPALPLGDSPAEVLSDASPEARELVMRLRGELDSTRQKAGLLLETAPAPVAQPGTRSISPMDPSAPTLSREQAEAILFGAATAAPSRSSHGPAAQSGTRDIAVNRPRPSTSVEALTSPLAESPDSVQIL